MKQTEKAFWMVGLLVLLVAVVLFAVSSSSVVEAETVSAVETYTMGQGTTTYEYVHETVAMESLTTDSSEVEYDPEWELGYLLMMAQDVDSVGELNELEERMYDVLEDYDEVEMEYFYEQMDNARERVEN
jgi:uncharacterized membrane protein YeiB